MYVYTCIDTSSRSCADINVFQVNMYTYIFTYTYIFNRDHVQMMKIRKFLVPYAPFTLRKRAQQLIARLQKITCNTLQRTAALDDSFAQHHLQHCATHCNTLRHTATHCNTLQHTATHCNALLHTATHCNTLQHTATHCNT